MPKYQLSVSCRAGWSRLNLVPHGFLSVACQPALPANADHCVWPQPPPPEPSEAEAVRLDVRLVEARLVAADALVVDGEMRDELLERAAVLGVPGQVLQLGGIHAGRLECGAVVEDRDRVPVLGCAVPLAVLALPQFRQALLVVAVLDSTGRAEVVEGAEDLQIDVLGELRQVVGEDVGRGVGDEAGGELGPVGVPAVLRDVDLQAGIGLGERVGALLVARLLGRVPQPVLDGAVRAATGCTAAGGQGRGGEQSDRGGADPLPEGDHAGLLT